jgi:hypothetical protein
VPKSYRSLLELLDATFKSYLHYIPHPSKPVTRSFEDICECVKIFHDTVPTTYAEAIEIYQQQVPGYPLLFDTDIEVAALYAALLLKDFNKARSLTRISKDKVLQFLQAKTAYEALESTILETYTLPKVENGISFEYWKHMNVFDRDHEDALSQLKETADKTHFALSYLMNLCEIAMGHTLQIGFKEL